MENIFYNEDLVLSALFIKDLPNGKLFYCQDRLTITNSTNHIIHSLDVIDFIQQAF